MRIDRYNGHHYNQYHVILSAICVTRGCRVSDIFLHTFPDYEIRELRLATQIKEGT
jgi:hypothetical protein